MGAQFVAVAEAALDDQLRRRPGWATVLGDHRGDDRLDDLSPAAVGAELAAIDRHRRALDPYLTGRDPGGPDPVGPDPVGPDPGAQERVDAATLAALLDGRRFALADLRRHEWDPLVHLPGEALHALLARPYAPAADRLRALAGRLGALPDALATARTVLAEPSRIHARTAVDQVTGLELLAGPRTTDLLAVEPRLRSVVEPAQRQALAALADFRGWLTDRSTDRQGPGRDPRLGADLWGSTLAYALDSDLSGEQVVAAARTHLEELTEQITGVAAGWLGEPAGPGTVRRALDRLAADAPDDGSIVADARAALADVTAFTAAADLVTLPDDPLEIVVMPEFARGVAIAYCDPPGPLETTSLPTFFAIAPTPADWTADRRASFYREYNRAQLRDLAVHEAVPGHHVQLAHGRRFRGPTRVRAALWSGTFVEGWAVYAEELVAGRGCGGAPQRLQQLKLQLRSTINALLDHGVHAGGMSWDEAMALMTGRGFQEEGEAHGKWRRAQLTAGQLSTYFVGWTEVAALARDARRPGESDRSLHDRLLAHGSPSPRHLRTLVT